MVDLSALPPGLRAQVEADLRGRLDRVELELRERQERARVRALFTPPAEPAAPAPRHYGGTAADWLPMGDELRG